MQQLLEILGPLVLVISQVFTTIWMFTRLRSNWWQTRHAENITELKSFWGDLCQWACITGLNICALLFSICLAVL